MSKYFNLARTQRHKVQPGKRSIWQWVQGQRLLLNVGMFILLVGLGIGYLLQINTTATSGFAVKDLTTELREIQDGQQKLQLQIADLQSLQKIQASTERLQLVAQTRLEFVNPAAGAVALEK